MNVSEVMAEETKSVRRNSPKELEPGGFGYRVEDYQGSGVTSAVDILQHEVEEMGNEADLEVAADTLGVAANLLVVTAEIKRGFGPDAQGVWLASKKRRKDLRICC